MTARLRLVDAVRDYLSQYRLGLYGSDDTPERLCGGRLKLRDAQSAIDAMTIEDHRIEYEEWWVYLDGNHSTKRSFQLERCPPDGDYVNADHRIRFVAWCAARGVK